MTELAAISRELHAKKAWKNVIDYAFSAEDTVIPLVAVELKKVVPAMPIAFIEDGSGYQLVAITALKPRTNLYVTAEGKWLVPYIPAALRAYPFKLVRLENEGKMTLCINEASGLVMESEEEGNAFFDDHGEPTQKIKDVINFLSKFEADRALTQRAVSALADAGLIIPWKLTHGGDNEVAPVNDLFRVDEPALNKLCDADFLALRKAGSLALAYSQLLSMHQLAVLTRLVELQGQMRARTAAIPDVLNLGDFSLSGDEGSLVFD